MIILCTILHDVELLLHVLYAVHLDIMRNDVKVFFFFFWIPS